MKGFLQFEITVTLFSGFILITSCLTETKKQSPIVENSKQEPVSNAAGDSSIFFKGEAIFEADCNKCHVSKRRPHNYLEGVVQRVGIDYLKLYLTKQDSLVSAKDSNALRLKEIWGNKGNSHNFNYLEEELGAIVEYLR